MNLEVLVTVLRKPAYSAMAVLVSVIVFTFAVLLPNFQLITVVFLSNASTIVEKGLLILSLTGSIQTNFTVLAAGTVLLVSVLFGLQVALLAYYVKRARSGIKVGTISASSLGGLVSGMFGIGCAACGTFVLTSLLTLLGVSGLLVFLPFGGEEFGFIGVALLVYSIYILTNRIKDPMVCEITS